MKPPAGVATRSYRVAVVGLGKIGLPLAAQLAGKGHTVVKCSPDTVTSQHTLALDGKSCSECTVRAYCGSMHTSRLCLPDMSLTARASPA